MRVIVAGSRDVQDLAAVERAIEKSGFQVTEVVSGTAKGADSLGEVWAIQRGIPIMRFPANWNLGLQAGPMRNQRMAEYGEALVAVWKNSSSGTADMIRRASERGLPVFVEVV